MHAQMRMAVNSSITITRNGTMTLEEQHERECQQTLPNSIPFSKNNGHE